MNAGGDAAGIYPVRRSSRWRSRRAKQIATAVMVPGLVGRNRTHGQLTLSMVEELVAISQMLSEESDDDFQPLAADGGGAVA